MPKLLHWGYTIDISAMHERRVNIADADVVTPASKPQDALAAHRDQRRYGSVAAKMMSLKNKVREKCTTNEK
jgi:hypothetical protein